MQSDTDHFDHTVIAGAGIAGLTLAITLARHGVRSTVLETLLTPNETGAGIQLGPNATRIFHDLGILDTLKLDAVAPESIVVANCKSNRTIVELPLGDWMLQRYDAPYLVIHRADLQAALLHHALELDEIDLRFGNKVCRISQDCGRFKHKSGITKFILKNGVSVSSPLVVGSDGIWSSTRKSFRLNQVDLSYSGMSASRSIIKSADLPEKFQRLATHVWLAPNAHIVMYPVRRGVDVAFVVVTQDSQPKKGWGDTIDQRIILKAFNELHHDVAEILQLAGHWKQWSLLDTKPLPSWYEKQIVLIGDAAHPILPFMAQGGAMAIEDGYVLGRLIAQLGTNPSQIFPVFEKMRRNRIECVQDASRKNGQIYHMKGFMAKGRDFVMRSVPPSFLMKKYDWIYNWRYTPAADI